MFYFCRGEMAERSNAAVLKTVDCQRSGGSNPSLSAKKSNAPLWGIFYWWSVESLLSKATAIKNDKGEAQHLIFWWNSIDVWAKRRQSLSLRQTSSKPTNFRGFFVFQTSEACFSEIGKQKTCGEAMRVLSDVWSITKWWDHEIIPLSPPKNQMPLYGAFFVGKRKFYLRP